MQPLWSPEQDYLVIHAQRTLTQLKVVHFLEMEGYQCCLPRLRKIDWFEWQGQGQGQQVLG